MRKEALGIAINGRDVKIAHVFQRDKHTLAVDYLETAVLMTDLELEAKRREAEAAEKPLGKEETDVFALKSPYETKEPAEKGADMRDNANVLYSLLRKFAARKMRVAFNVSPSIVSYQDLDTRLDYDDHVIKGSLKKKIENWKQGFNAIDNVSVINRRDGTACNVSCETPQPPIVDILEQINTFFQGNLYLSLMDSNEIALINLARNSYNFRDYHEISVIIQIETEFSRIIFMKGDDLLTVSPIIPEGISPEINDIIYSKVIYELDNLNIPEINTILLAGKANSFRTKTFFEQKFPKVKVGFIISQPLSEQLSTQYNREDLSEYAIPIALAWKVVDAKSENFIPTNLLPSQLIDRQRVLKLSLVSYLLLFLLALSAFILTWKITTKKLDISSYERKNVVLAERINSSEQTVKRVQQIDEEILKLDRRLSLSDSLSRGWDRLLSFLERLNQSAMRIESVWIDEVQSTNKGFVVKGMALKRGKAPELAEELGRAMIRKLTRAEYGSRKLFIFEMEVDWSQPTIQPDFERQLSPELFEPLESNSEATQIAGFSNLTSETSLPSNQTGFSEKFVDESAPVKPDISSQKSETNLPLQANGNNQATDEIDYEMTSGDNQKTDEAELDLNNNTELVSNRMTNSSEERYSSSRREPEGFLDGSSHCTIRISAHACRFTAQKEVENFISIGYEPYVTTFPNKKSGITYWVCLGDFPTYEAAEQKVQELHHVIPRAYDIVGISEDQVNQIASTHSPTHSEKSSFPGQSPADDLIKNANNGSDVSNSKKAINRIESDHVQQNSQFYTSDPGSEYFSIMVSSHAIKLTANKDVEFLRAKGYEPYITTLPNSSPEIPYSVCLGKFAAYSEAMEKIQELNQVIPRKYNVISINK